MGQRQVIIKEMLPEKISFTIFETNSSFDVN